MHNATSPGQRHVLFRAGAERSALHSMVATDWVDMVVSNNMFFGITHELNLGIQNALNQPQLELLISS